LGLPRRGSRGSGPASSGSPCSRSGALFGALDQNASYEDLSLDERSRCVPRRARISTSLKSIFAFRCPVRGADDHFSDDYRSRDDHCSDDYCSRDDYCSELVARCPYLETRKPMLARRCPVRSGHVSLDERIRFRGLDRAFGFRISDWAFGFRRQGPWTAATSCSLRRS